MSAEDLSFESVYLLTTDFEFRNPVSGSFDKQKTFRFATTNPHASHNDAVEIADMLSGMWKKETEC